MPTKKTVQPQTPDENDTLFAPKAVTNEKQKESWEIWEEEKAAERKAKNIYQKLQEAKTKVIGQVKEKSGNNAYNKFKYLELADFLPATNEVFEELGLFQQFRIITNTDSNGVDQHTALLTVYNSDNPAEKIEYSMRCEIPDMKGNTNMQLIGSMHTYARRYLAYEMLSLAVPDDLDKLSGSDKLSKNTKTTADQIAILTELIMDMPEKGKILLDHYKAKTISDLTLSQASEAIKTMKIYRAKKNANTASSNTNV